MKLLGTSGASALVLVAACQPVSALPPPAGSTGSSGTGSTTGSSGTTGADSTGSDSGSDTGGSSTGDPGHCPDFEEPDLPEPEFGSMYIAPNRDDDDQNGAEDWDDAFFVDDDELYELEVPGDLFVGDGNEIGLAMAGDVGDVRVYYEEELLLGAGATEPCPTIPRSGATLRMEIRDFWRNVSLTFHRLDLSGNAVESQTIRLASSPLLIGHHLQQAEEFWVVGYEDFALPNNSSLPHPANNVHMVETMRDVLGPSHVNVVPGDSVIEGGWIDDWIQDEMELGQALGDRGNRGYPVVIDSPRDRGLAVYPPTLDEPDRPVLEWAGSGTSQDSYGNLEATPPHTDSVGNEYPLGRVYYGVDGGTALHTALREELFEPEVQLPIPIDVTFLSVGHVDEIISFLPDPASPKGFKLVLASPERAFDILDGLDPAQALPMYRDAYGFDTVGDVLADMAFRDLNEEVQQDHIDPVREQLKTELDLSESDIIDVPVTFAGSGGSHAAFTTDLVNMLVATCEAGTTHVFVPDPFLRDDVGDAYTAYDLGYPGAGLDRYDPNGDPMDVGDQSSDPFIQDFVASMPANVEAHFVDDWYYHLRDGEVHCGTNTRRRIPVEDSWAALGDLPPLQEAPWTCGCTPQDYEGMPPAFVGTPSPTASGELDWAALDAELVAYEDRFNLQLTVAVPYEPGNGCGAISFELPTPCDNGYTDYKVWRMGGAVGTLLFPPQLPPFLNEWVHNPGFFAEGMMDPFYTHPAKTKVVGCMGLGVGYCAIGSYGDGLSDVPLEPSDLARTDPTQGPMQPGAYDGHIRAFPVYARPMPDPTLPEGYQTCFDVIDLHAQGGAVSGTCQNDGQDHGRIYLTFQAREKICDGT